MTDQDCSISTSQLQIGVYVYLDVGWMHHPFSFNNFKIKSEDQIRTIQSLGLDKVRWDPDRSDLRPLPAGTAPLAAVSAAAATATAARAETSVAAGAAPSAAAESPPALAAEVVAANEAAVAAKQVRIERLRVQRDQLAKVQQAFVSANATVRAISKDIFSKPKETIAQSEQLVRQMVDTFLSAPEVAIQVMGEKPGGEEVYLHALNVSVLSMMIGRELALPAETMGQLGIGCLFHDIGLTEIPAKILNKVEPLTKSERDFYEMHCAYGVDIARRVGLTEAVQTIIRSHHEFQDGSGYPDRLKGEAIHMLARIVVVTSHYDSLCNPVNISAALTPHEALSLMFAQQRAKFDPKILQIFIRCLGVFPPGTVVRLNNDVVGLVISINAARPLKPSVIIHDPDVPRHEAIIVDLDAEPDISISKAIRPAHLPKAIYDYLSPRKRISYYFDADAGKSAQS